MEHDERPGSRAVLVGHRFDRRRVQHERLWLEIDQLGSGWLDEQRLREERVVRAVGDDAHGYPMRRISSRERVDDIQARLRVEIRDDLAA